jgi:hypothetical protein
MATVTYNRPSGVQITVNDTPETRELAAQHGWVEKKTRKPRKKKEG